MTEEIPTPEPTPARRFTLEDHFNRKAFVTTIAVGAVYLALTHFGLFDRESASTWCVPVSPEASAKSRDFQNIANP